MKIADIMELTGASKATVYRWMERHPTLADDAESLAAESNGGPLGTPFPKPVRKEGRVVIWDDTEVRVWWAENERHIGRHPEESHIIEMPYKIYRAAMSYPVETYIDEDGTEVAEDWMASITKTERLGEKVRIWFRDKGDAVLFRLKF